VRALQVEDMVSIILRHERGYRRFGRIGKMGSVEELVYAVYRTQFILLY
jgi:hypothetical protein